MNNNNLVGYDDIADESFFCNFKAEETVGVLLNKVRENLEKTITTEDQAIALVNSLTSEAADYNKCLTTVLNAYHEAEAGRMSKQEAIEIAKPCIASLKEAAVKLLGSESDLATDNSDINEVELRCLKEFIVGCKTLAEERKAVLNGEEGAKRPDGKAGTLVDNARGGILEAMNNIDYVGMTAATEADQASLIIVSPETKTANVLLKKAKAMRKADPQKALSMVNEAEQRYIKLLAKVEKLAPVKNGEFTQSAGAFGTGVKLKTNTKVYNNVSIGSAVAFFQDRIAACRALKLLWENKGGKSSYKEMKQQIKAELKERRKASKETKKAAKAEAKAAKRAAKAGSAAAESFSGDLDSILNDLEIATESVIDDDYIVDDVDIDEVAVEASLISSLIEAGFEDEIDDL